MWRSRHRDRFRETETEGETERQRDRETERQRDRERDTEGQIQRDKGTKGKGDRQTNIQQKSRYADRRHCRQGRDGHPARDVMRLSAMCSTSSRGCGAREDQASGW
jgi:hypothetical protein